MNGRRAKEIRRKVYGENSLKGERDYRVVDMSTWMNPTHNRHMNRSLGNFTVVAAGLRGMYRMMKYPKRVGILRLSALSNKPVR
jgi:hypothetical protein